MITTGSKWFYGVGTVVLVIASLYGYTTGGTELGPVTVGYWGGVGDHIGYGILVATGTLLLFLGIISTAVRDADAAAVAQVAGTDAPPAVTPVGTSVWPIVSGLAVGLVVLGVVTSTPAFALGIVVLTIVLVEWAVRSWSDRATGDAETNRTIRNRFMYPVEIPLGGALAIGFVVVSVSRVLLAVSAAGAVWVALAVSVAVLGIGWLVSARPQLSSDALAAILVVAALVVLVVGIVGLAQGEREFHEHGEEHAEETAE